MLRIKVDIRQCSHAFMDWFDCLIDKLVGIHRDQYPSAFGCLTSPHGEHFAAEADRYVVLRLSSCSYLDYRVDLQDSIGEPYRYLGLPLFVELVAFRCAHPDLPKVYPSVTIPKAVGIGLDDSSGQMHLTIDYDIYEPDALLWLLRAFATEYPKVKEQLRRNYQGIVVELLSRASEAGQQEHGAWVESIAEVVPARLKASDSGAALDAQSRSKSKIRRGTLIKVVEVLLRIWHDDSGKTVACDRAHISHNTFNRWKDDARVRAKFEKERERYERQLTELGFEEFIDQLREEAV